MMKKILVVAGPTAAGKTRYAIELAERFNGEIVSCDSMQIYKYMNIGSAKPTDAEQERVKHHLISEIDPREDFSVALYKELATKAIKEIHGKDKLPIVSGGSGLYLNGVLYEMDFGKTPRRDHYRQELEQIGREEGGEGLHRLLEKQDPDAAGRIHPNNIKRLIRALEAVNATGEGIKPFQQAKRPVTDYVPILLGLTRDRKELYQRINRRVEHFFEQGLVEEVRTLLDMGLTEENISMKGIGYKEIVPFLQGKCSLSETKEKIQQNTRHYAKRQLTWFRKYDKMKWYNLSQYTDEHTALEEIAAWVSKNR